VKLSVALAATTSFIIIGSLVMGAIIGLIELFFVHADERGLGWLSHGLHAIPIAMIFTFAAMNIDWFMVSVIKWKAYHSSIPIQAGLRFVIGLIAAIQVKAKAAVIQGHGSVGEKLGHAVIIGALIAVSPYIWAVLAPQLPAMLRDR
jgi:hypothetical protein